MRLRAGVVGFAVVVLMSGCTAAGHPSSTHASSPSRSGTPTATAPSRPRDRLPPPVTGSLPAAKVQAFQQALDQRDPSLRGLTAAVVTDHGTWEGAAGKDGAGTPLTPRSMFPVGSITKTFTAAEVMHLAAAGRVDLDAPLTRYLPNRLSQTATVREVLGMLSGIPDDTSLESVSQRVDKDPHAHLDPRVYLALEKGPLAKPGEKQVYSNANFLLLGQLVEKITGTSLATAFTKDLFKPAGLNRIVVQDAQRPMAPVAAPPRNLQGLDLSQPDGYLPCRAWASVAGGAGSIAADAPTMARWGYQLYGARLLPPARTTAMMTPQTPVGLAAGEGYGLGTTISREFSIQPVYGHAGGIAGFTSLLEVDPVRHLSVVVLLIAGGEIPDGDSLSIGSGIMQSLLSAASG